MPKKSRKKEVSLAESAYQQIKEEILRNKFPSGEFLSIRDLSVALNGMGRTPVREAVQRLHEERLLTVVPRKGVIIPEFDIKKMMDQLEIRHVLERHAAVKAADNIDDEGLEELKSILEDMVSSEGKGSYQLARLNMMFHIKIVQAANNHEIVDMLSRIYDHHIRIYTFFLTDATRFNVTHKEHWEIYEAISAGDKDKIRSSMDDHFESTRQQILASILQ
ncbi:MAG TPA: GntR family transcriptional regulator [Acidobacteriota bacterium]|nr:GntR family transcriptional regulator [Acidobacteriota bacterium]